MGLTVLKDLGDTVLVECDCGKTFFSSPCGEENCYWDPIRKCLFPMCPDCGETEAPNKPVGNHA